MKRLLYGTVIGLIFLSLLAISVPKTPIAPVKASLQQWDPANKAIFVNITNTETGALLDLSVPAIHIDIYKNVTITYSVQDGEPNDTAVELMGSGAAGLDWIVGDGPHYCSFVSQDAANISYYVAEINVTASTTNFKANLNPLEDMGENGWEDADNHVIYATGAVVYKSFAAYPNGTIITDSSMNGAIMYGSKVQFVINASVSAGSELFMFGYQILKYNSSKGDYDTPFLWSTPSASYNATWKTLGKATNNYWAYDLPANNTDTEGYVIEFKGIYDENRNGQADGPEYEAGLPANRIIYVDMSPPTIIKTGPAVMTVDIGTLITLTADISDPSGIFVNGTIKIGDAAATTINMTALIDATGVFSYDIPTTGMSAGGLSVVLTVYDNQRYFIGGDAHLRENYNATYTWAFTLQVPVPEFSQIPQYLLLLIPLGLVTTVVLRRHPRK